MKLGRFTEEQIIGILREQEAGARRRIWRARYLGSDDLQLEGEVRRMDVSEAKRLKQLEDENVKLKKLLAEQMSDVAAMQELLSVSLRFPSPSGRQASRQTARS